ncbi:hypothetical protein [Alteromonas facilis]|uniref:hypothetical protein n=1 Tax=Alteromonas facilis TaxID=2048004 RepID=UPI000C286F3E|nr:hypothetical protein [Alteromonas facilis]
MKTLIALSLIALTLSPTAFAAAGKTHFPGIFVGNTNFDGENDFTLGLEYEYRFDPKWGVEFVYERINDAHHGDGTTILVAQIMYHPFDYFRIGAGVGEEKIGGAHPHDETLYRLTFAYDFQVSDFEIAPTLSFDRIDSETAVVAGLAFIYPF